MTMVTTLHTAVSSLHNAVSSVGRVSMGLGATALIVAGTALAYSSFYTIDQSQRGALLLNGAYVETVGPGLHVKLPWLQSVRVMPGASVPMIALGDRMR